MTHTKANTDNRRQLFVGFGGVAALANVVILIEATVRESTLSWSWPPDETSILDHVLLDILPILRDCMFYVRRALRVGVARACDLRRLC